MRNNTRAAEETARTAEEKLEDERRVAQTLKAEVVQAKRNEGNARRNAAEEKRKRLELEAELQEMRELLKVRGNT